MASKQFFSKQFFVDFDNLTIDEIRNHLNENLKQFEIIQAWGVNKNKGVVVRENQSFGALVTLNSKKKIIKIQESLGSPKFSLSALTIPPEAKENLMNSVYNLLKEKYASVGSDVPPQKQSSAKFKIGLILTIFSLFIIVVNCGIYFESGNSENLFAAFLLSILGYWGIKLMINSKQQ